MKSEINIGGRRTGSGSILETLVLKKYRRTTPIADIGIKTGQLQLRVVIIAIVCITAAVDTIFRSDDTRPVDFVETFQATANYVNSIGFTLQSERNGDDYETNDSQTEISTKHILESAIPTDTQNIHETVRDAQIDSAVTDKILTTETTSSNATFQKHRRTLSTLQRIVLDVSSFTKTSDNLVTSLLELEENIIKNVSIIPTSEIDCATDSYNILERSSEQIDASENNEENAFSSESTTEDIGLKESIFNDIYRKQITSGHSEIDLTNNLETNQIPASLLLTTVKNNNSWTRLSEYESVEKGLVASSLSSRPEYLANKSDTDDIDQPLYLPLVRGAEATTPERRFGRPSRTNRDDIMALTVVQTPTTLLPIVSRKSRVQGLRNLSPRLTSTTPVLKSQSRSGKASTGSFLNGWNDEDEEVHDETLVVAQQGSLKLTATSADRNNVSAAVSREFAAGGSADQRSPAQRYSNGRGLLSEEITTVSVAVASVIVFWTFLAIVVCVVLRMRSRRRSRRQRRSLVDATQAAMLDQMIRGELARGRAKLYDDDEDVDFDDVINDIARRQPAYVNLPFPFPPPPPPRPTGLASTTSMLAELPSNPFYCPTIRDDLQHKRGLAYSTSDTCNVNWCKVSVAADEYQGAGHHLQLLKQTMNNGDNRAWGTLQRLKVGRQNEQGDDNTIRNLVRVKECLGHLQCRSRSFETLPKRTRNLMEEDRIGNVDSVCDERNGLKCMAILDDYNRVSTQNNVKGSKSQHHRAVPRTRSFTSKLQSEKHISDTDKGVNRFNNDILHRHNGTTAICHLEEDYKKTHINVESGKSVISQPLNRELYGHHASPSHCSGSALSSANGKINSASAIRYTRSKTSESGWKLVTVQNGYVPTRCQDHCTTIRSIDLDNTQKQPKTRNNSNLLSAKIPWRRMTNDAETVGRDLNDRVDRRLIAASSSYTAAASADKATNAEVSCDGNISQFACPAFTAKKSQTNNKTSYPETGFHFRKNIDLVLSTSDDRSYLNDSSCSGDRATRDELLFYPDERNGLYQVDFLAISNKNSRGQMQANFKPSTVGMHSKPITSLTNNFIKNNSYRSDADCANYHCLATVTAVPKLNTLTRPCITAGRSSMTRYPKMGQSCLVVASSTGCDVQAMMKDRIDSAVVASAPSSTSEIRFANGNNMTNDNCQRTEIRTEVSSSIS